MKIVVYENKNKYNHKVFKYDSIYSLWKERNPELKIIYIAEIDNLVQADNSGIVVKESESKANEMMESSWNDTFEWSFH